MRVFGDDLRVSRGPDRRATCAGTLRIAFDSRPVGEGEVGGYARSLLVALREVAPRQVEIVEMHRPAAGGGRRADLFHSPWMEGAALRCPCPSVVTLHDVDALTRRSERLRRGGVHTRLRHLALQRATHVIVRSDALARQALTQLGLERDRVVVIPHPPDASTWEGVAQATWEVYERALRAPPRPFISRPRAASAPLGSS